VCVCGMFTFENLDLERSSLVHRYIVGISRRVLSTEVITSSSRSREHKWDIWV